jgi:hypothetical protein
MIFISAFPIASAIGPGVSWEMHRKRHFPIMAIFIDEDLV